MHEGEDFSEGVNKKECKYVYESRERSESHEGEDGLPKSGKLGGDRSDIKIDGTRMFITGGEEQSSKEGPERRVRIDTPVLFRGEGLWVGEDFKFKKRNTKNWT